MSMALIAASTVARELQAEVNRLREQVASLTRESDKMRERFAEMASFLEGELLAIENYGAESFDEARARDCLAKVREMLGATEPRP